MKNNVLGPLALGLVLIVLTGCATTADEPIEQTIEERAQARWDLMLAQEYVAAREYYTPAFREANPPSAFVQDLARRQVRWTRAEVQSADCDEQRCGVDVRVHYRAGMGPAEFRNMELSRVIDETWIRLDGQWWYVQQ
jgi:hypothetical protein